MSNKDPSKHSVIGKFFRTIVKQKKPTKWGPTWPINYVIIKHRRDDFSFIDTLSFSGFSFVFCVPTNNKAIELEHQLKHEYRPSTVFRYVSKAQHLTERLDSIGVQGFKLAYYHSSCPYALGGIDKPTTVQSLQSALGAAGHGHLDADAIFEQEFEDYRCELPDAKNTRIWIFTNTAFQARLTGFRTHWWQTLGLIRKYKPFVSLGRFDPSTGENHQMAFGDPNIAVIYVEPPESEFDDHRSIHEDDFETLQSAMKTYQPFRLKRQEPKYWLDQGYTDELGYDDEWRQSFVDREIMAHHLIEGKHLHLVHRLNGQPIEWRPNNLRFGNGIARGYPSRSECPKVIVLTSNSSMVVKAKEYLQSQHEMFTEFDICKYPVDLRTQVSSLRF